jgi:hypothetical protein
MNHLDPDAAAEEAALADMKRREGEWEDNGCRPLTGYEPIEDDWSQRP